MRGRVGPENRGSKTCGCPKGVQMDLIIRIGDQRPDPRRKFGSPRREHESKRTVYLSDFVPARPKVEYFCTNAVPSFGRAAVDHLSRQHRVDAECVEDC